MATFQNFSYYPPRPLSDQSPSHNPDDGFAILAIAVLAISAAAFLLYIYYFFATKCYLRRRRLDCPGNRAPFRENQVRVYPFHEFLIQELPTFKYLNDDQVSSCFLKCVVCLKEFQGNELLRALPKCKHAFHIQCIDAWLHNISNCPLCRSTISYTNEEDFVVIELSEEDGSSERDQEINDSSRILRYTRSNSLGKLRERHHGSVIGFEETGAREKDEEFSVRPIRRSLSVDSAVRLPMGNASR